MALKLIDSEAGLDIEIELPEALYSSIVTQWERAKFEMEVADFSRDISKLFENLVAEFVDWDIKPPTKSQTAYANLLCAKFGIKIAPDEKNFRGPMAQFLGYHSYNTNKDRRFEDDDFDAG